MNCYKCGEKVNDEITLCPNCGTYLQATPELIQHAISNDQSAIEALYHIAYSNVYPGLVSHSARTQSFSHTKIRYVPLGIQRSSPLFVTLT